MAATVAWWLAIEGAGLLGLPIAYVIFRRLPDRGYTFAKPVSILLGAYLFWLALSLHVLPNRPGSIVWCFVALAAASGYITSRHKDEMREALSVRLPAIVAVEAVFTIALFTAAHLRSYIPDIAGTEKPMDFMLLNATGRSRFYPPDDPWLSGFGVSYYYFGYVIQAMLGKLTATPSAVAFNLGLASTAALAASVATGLGYNVVSLRRGATVRAAIGAGLVAALLLTVMGNMEGVLEFARAHGVGSDGLYRSMGIAHLADAARSNTWYPSDQSNFWWWWRATRMTPDANSITEFPFFSFLLGDLHPHVMAIPYVVTAVGVGLALYQEDELSFASWRARPSVLVAIAVFLGGLGFLNTWDLPMIGFLVSTIIVARNLGKGGGPRAAIGKSAGFLLPLGAVATVAYLPFYLSFHSQASGFLTVQGGASRPLHAALFWLPLVVLTLPVAIARLVADRESWTGSRVRLLAGIPIALVIVWLGLLLVDKGSEAVREAVSARGWNWLTLVFFGGAFVSASLACWREAESPSDEGPGAPVFAIMATAYLLILGAELFFIKDVFHSRLNTVFKLYYQAWILLALSGSWGVYWLVGRWRASTTPSRDVFRGIAAGLTVLIIGGAFLYPLGATLSRTDGLAGKNRSLDGVAFARRDNPEEMAAIDWLLGHTDAGDIILEAIDGQYSTGGRVSGRTGIPTVLGWAQHEVQWGRDPNLVSARNGEVDLAYTTESLAEAVTILRKYRVRYVVVGVLERTKYPPSGLQKFATGLEAVRSGPTTIYRVPPASPDSEQEPR